ncbi:MAG: hypothetical protein EA355_12005 [Rhodobacteraceae bacterium]|nr:MAG: hypothetical protein EA355_12005 [Paracoccaceae bacterium]
MPDGAGAPIAVRREQPCVGTSAGDPEPRAVAPSCVAPAHPRAPFDLRRAERRGRCAHWSRTDRKRVALDAAQVAAWRGCFEAARRENLIRRLRDSETVARRRAVVAERANDAAIIADAPGETVWVSAAFVRTTGYALSDMVGRTPGA